MKKIIGHIISKEDPERIRAIGNLARPQNVSELQWLLGMANHVGKFAKYLAETIKPLRDLLKKTQHGSGMRLIKLHSSH